MLKYLSFFTPEQTQLRAAKLAEERAAMATRQQAEQIARDKRDAEIRANSKWIYSDQVDEMRGTCASLARLVSENHVDLPFPWAGGTSGVILIRQLGLDYEASFFVNQGQFRFGRMIYVISTKADDKGILEWSARKPVDLKTNIMLLNQPESFIRVAAKAKRFIVEADFYNAGRHQFTFIPPGLDRRFLR